MYSGVVFVLMVFLIGFGLWLFLIKNNFHEKLGNKIEETKGKFKEDDSNVGTTGYIEKDEEVFPRNKIGEKEGESV